MGKKRYQKMTPEERAAQAERQRFIDQVVHDAAVRAGIEPTPEGRRRHIDRVIADLMAKKRATS